jgi:hypothetical protein
MFPTRWESVVIELEKHTARMMIEQLSGQWKGLVGKWDPRQPQCMHCGELKLTQEPSKSVPSCGGRVMADTVVSGLKLVGGDMAGTKTTMLETLSEELNMLYIVSM